jgi:hypothetical protein
MWKISLEFNPFIEVMEDATLSKQIGRKIHEEVQKRMPSVIHWLRRVHQNPTVERYKVHQGNHSRISPGAFSSVIKSIEDSTIMGFIERAPSVYISNVYEDEICSVNGLLLACFVSIGFESIIYNF